MVLPKEDLGHRSHPVDLTPIKNIAAKSNTPSAGNRPHFSEPLGDIWLEFIDVIEIFLVDKTFPFNSCVLYGLPQVMLNVYAFVAHFFSFENLRFVL